MSHALILLIHHKELVKCHNLVIVLDFGGQCVLYFLGLALVGKYFDLFGKFLDSFGVLAHFIFTAEVVYGI